MAPILFVPQNCGARGPPLASLYGDDGSILVGDGVVVPLLFRIVGLPSAGREDVLVTLVPAAQTHLACMRLVLLHFSVVGQSDVVVHVEHEEGPGLAPGLGDDEVIEGVVVGNDEVLLDVHQLVHADRLEVVELLAQRVQRPVQELLDGVALLQLDLAPMARPVPVAVGDGDLLRLDAFLLVLPLLAQLLPADSDAQPSLRCQHLHPHQRGELPSSM